jgi:hypothetical protein
MLRRRGPAPARRPLFAEVRQPSASARIRIRSASTCCAAPRTMTTSARFGLRLGLSLEPDRADRQGGERRRCGVGPAASRPSPDRATGPPTQAGAERSNDGLNFEATEPLANSKIDCEPPRLPSRAPRLGCGASADVQLPVREYQRWDLPLGRPHDDRARGDPGVVALAGRGRGPCRGSASRHRDHPTAPGSPRQHS